MTPEILSEHGPLLSGERLRVYGLYSLPIARPSLLLQFVDNFDMFLLRQVRHLQGTAVHSPPSTSKPDVPPQPGPRRLGGLPPNRRKRAMRNLNRIGIAALAMAPALPAWAG